MRILVDQLPDKPSKCYYSTKLPTNEFSCILRKGSHPCKEIEKCKVLTTIIDCMKKSQII